MPEATNKTVQENKGKTIEKAPFKSKLFYYAQANTRPFFFTRARREHEKEQFPADCSEQVDPMARPQVEVDVRDARVLQPTLDQHSFQRVDWPTSLSTQEFYDHDKVRNVYYKEMEEVMKKVTGAEHVMIFNHIIRNQEQISGMGHDTNEEIQAFSSGIHSDTHPWAAELFYRYLVEKTGREDLKKGAFMYLTGWRNILDTPVLDNHLVLCDENSLVKPDDYMVRDNFSHNKELGPKGSDYTIPQYVLHHKNSAQHRWYHFPGLTRDELVLHKQYDSDTTKNARYCFHTACKDPTAPPNLPCRTSIEVRAMLSLPNYEPNTIPASIFKI